MKSEISYHEDLYFPSKISTLIQNKKKKIKYIIRRNRKIVVEVALSQMLLIWMFWGTA